MTIIASVRSLANRLAKFVLPVAFALTAVVAVVLARQNADLNREVRTLHGQARLPHLHDVMPLVRTASLDGAPVALAGAGAKAQLLFVFDTKCHFCLETLPWWQVLAKALKPVPGISVYGVSVSPDSATRAYAVEHNLAYGVVEFPTHREQIEFRAIATPITMVVDSAGSVLYARGGALTQQAVDSLLTGMRRMNLIPGGAGVAPQSKSLP